jgi:hypothetical protein
MGLHMPYIDVSEESETQETIAENQNHAIERLIDHLTNKTTESATRTLLNNLLLNEIKAQEDSIKQVINITIILLGAYATVFANTIGKIPLDAISDKINIYKQEYIFINLTNNSTSDFNFTNGSIYVTNASVYTKITSGYIYLDLFLLYIIPTLWILSIVYAASDLKPDLRKMADIDQTTSIQFLINLAKSKYDTYIYSCAITLVGLIIAIAEAMKLLRNAFA